MAKSELSYEGWLAASVVGSQPDNRAASSLANHGPGHAGTIPASYISRAIADHNDGKKKILSGIRSPGVTVEGDLRLENYTIPFPLFLEQCRFVGNLHIWSIKAAATLSFCGSIFEEGADIRGTEVEGNFLMREGFVSHGPIIARDMKIGGSAEFTGAAFLYDATRKTLFEKAAAGECFGFSRSTASALYWRDMKEKPRATVNLRDAHIGAFIHDLQDDPPLRSWPSRGKLNLDGFSYDRIQDCDADRALAWIQLQPTFSASSYSALAKGYDRLGLRQKAEHVLSAFKRAEIEQIGNRFRRYVVFTIYWLIGFGQSPQRALMLIAVLFGMHLATVYNAQATGGMRPAINDMLLEPCFYGPSKYCTKNLGAWKRIQIDRRLTRYVPGDYPDLSAFQYSLESFVPIFNLKQKEYWEPANDALRLALSLAAALGIFLGGLFVGAMSGFLMPRIRQD